MRILLFASATTERLLSELKVISGQQHECVMIVQEKRKSVFESQYSNVRYITTNSDYIDYKLMKNRGDIPKEAFDEIWVPSTFKDNIYDYGEIYAIALEIKAKKIVWKSAEGKCIEIEAGIKDKIKDSFYSAVAYTWYCFCKWYTRLQSKIMGYKW